MGRLHPLVGAPTPVKSTIKILRYLAGKPCLRHLVVSRFVCPVGPQTDIENGRALACPTIELSLDRPSASPPLPKGTLCGRDNGATVASVAVDITNARLQGLKGQNCLQFSPAQRIRWDEKDTYEL